MTGPAVSVLTPTYNRGHVLHRVYDSLCRQKTRDFEWVVVDDGSTDNTPTLLARWQAEANFPITWFRYSNNRGQIPATNEGRKLVTGEYTLKLDSDDALLDGAMEAIEIWRKKTEADTKEKICGLAFRCVDQHGVILGKLKDGKSNFPQEVLQLSTRYARYCLGIDFDIAVLYKTELYLTMGYGELDNSENLPPSIGLNRLTDRYELIYVDYPIRTYFTQDGVARLSDKPLDRVKWPRGRYLQALSILNEDSHFFWRRSKVFFNAGRKITRLGMHIGRSPLSQLQDLTNWRARLLWATGIPGGLIGFLGDRLRGRTAPAADADITAWGPSAPPEMPTLHLPPVRFRR